MKFFLQVSLGTLLFASLLDSRAWAQVNPNLEEGLSPYGSYQGGNIDSVSMTNGNLLIHAPLISYRQRGGKLSLAFFIRYSHKNWRIVRYGSYYGGSSWTWDYRGVEVVRDQAMNSDFSTPLSFFYRRNANDPGVWISIDQAKEPDGAVHFLRSSSNEFPQYSTHPALDGSGVVGGLDRAGIRYSTSSYSSPVIGFNQGYRRIGSEDPNGNKISVSSTDWIDTLGRAIPDAVITTDYTNCLSGTVGALVWNFPGPNGGVSPIKLCYANFQIGTSFGYFDSYTGSMAAECCGGAVKLLREIVLPNGAKWVFSYDSYGGLASITFPTGGSISYTWATKSFQACYHSTAPMSRFIVSRTVNANDGTPPRTWNYNWEEAYVSGQGYLNTHTATDPAGDATRYTVPGCRVETKREYFQGSAGTGTLLKTVETAYQAIGNPYASFYGVGEYNTFLPVTVTTKWANGKTTKTETEYTPGIIYSIYDYGQYYLPPGGGYANPPLYQYATLLGNVRSQTEYEYGAGSVPGPAAKKTITDYVYELNQNYKDSNLIDLPSLVRVQGFDVSGNPFDAAKTQYAYDEGTLQPSGVTTQLNPSITPPRRRGNLTSLGRWNNSTNTFLTSATAFYDTGLPYQTTDPGGHTMTFSYSSAFAGAYVTQTQLPNTNSPNFAQHIISGNYDFNTGLLTSFTDENGKTSTYSYDTMFRITAGNFPDGGQSTIFYNDAVLPSATLTKKITATQNFVTTNRFDGFGRVTRSELTSDPQGTVITATTYDGLGRKATVSNPYRSTSEPTYGITTHQYDALGRITKVIPPDGASTANNVTTTYSGNCATVSDQAGKTRKSCADALGRLVEVNEGGALSPAGVATGSVAISGEERSTTVNFCPPMYCPNTFWDSGQVSITVNGFTASASYGQSSTAGAIAASLAATLNSASSPVTASASGSVVNLTARLSGSAYNYPLSASSSTSQPQYFSSPSFRGTPSGSTLTGGSDPSYSQSGALTTMYSYDTLDNLACVVQKGTDTSPFTNCASAPATWRPRSFAYNSLSQLLTATNPESGTISYTYDNDGNVLTKTDARGITINYSPTESPIDALHRVTKKTYSNGETPITFAYDQTNCLGLTCYNIGRRTAMTDAAGSEAWAYDEMGRPRKDQRTTNSVTKTTSYTYNLDGSIATLTYPSGRTVTYAYNAAARPVSAVDSVGPINYATGASYAPAGALVALTNGASLVSTFYYNSRLQPCRISARSAGVSPANCADTTNIGNVLDFKYDFALGTANNGNVASITNNRTPARSVNFAYDALNRIATAQTTSTFATSPSHCWAETYSIDPWGNLYASGANTSTQSAYVGCTQDSGLSSSATNKNQLSGYGYDAAGNMTSVPSVATYTYNAENQLTATGGVTYAYDGDGKRVKKSNGKLYWYGTGSDPLTETDLAGTPSAEFIFFNGKRTARLDLPSATVHYYFSDHLGSANVVTSSTGAIQDESDYYPFGGERVITNSDTNQYKFTGKERDSESNLDYFGARYYASTLGRFASSDPKARSAKLSDPQTWNRYAYVGNNPLAFIDPDGRDKLSVTLTTSIPTSTIREPLFRPFAFGRTFSGGPKTGHTVLIETDVRKSANPELSKSHQVFPTKLLDSTGQVKEVRQGSDRSLREGATRSDDGSVNVNFQGNASLPFNAIAPGITYDINVTCSGSTCSATSGSHDGFPGYQIEVTNEAGQTATIYEYDPRAADKGPNSLFPPAECKVGGASECDRGVTRPKQGTLPPRQNCSQSGSKCP